MRITIFFLILAGTYLQAQNIENKEAFKKCSKEFNKKECLADEDRDGIPFTLIKGCGQIINTDSLKPAPKTK